jgi:hypothetical protein
VHCRWHLADALRDLRTALAGTTIVPAIHRCTAGDLMRTPTE